MTAPGTAPAGLCHPADASLPDCYRRVTVYREPLGALVGLATLPAGVSDIRSPRSGEARPGPDWAGIRARYEALGGETAAMVDPLRTVWEHVVRLRRSAEITRQNGRALPLAAQIELNTWDYRLARMLGSREGRSEVQDTVADQQGWW